MNNARSTRSNGNGVDHSGPSGSCVTGAAPEFRAATNEDVTCPRCKHVFALAIVLREQMETKVRKEIEKDFCKSLDERRAEFDSAIGEKQKELAVAKQQAAFAQAESLRKTRELEAREQAFDLTLEKKLDAERPRMREEAEREACERYERAAACTTRLREQELADAKLHLDKAAATQAELVTKVGDLEEGKRRAEAEAKLRVQHETRALRDELERKAATDRALLEAEQVERLAQANATILDLQRKLTQGSQQIQGEAQEIVLADRLTRAFPRDHVADVPKGVEGGDLVETVRDDLGADAGAILWESKRTKTLSDKAVDKIIKDQRAINATHAVIVTQVMPNGMVGFGDRKGVWICTPEFVVPVATVLRRVLLEVAETTHAYEGHTEKMKVMYDYLTGAECKARIRGALEAFRDMQNQLSREQRSVQASWKVRARQLDRALTSLSAFYGDIRGIAGGQIEAIEAFELGDNDAPALGTPSGCDDTILTDLLDELVPVRGSIGNKALFEAFQIEARHRQSVEVDGAIFERCKSALLTDGRIAKGKGRGGSVRRSARARK